MPGRFIDDYDVLLLDMGNTFMFETDRFHDAAEIAATYAREGGTLLQRDRIASIIAEMESLALRYGRDSAYWERFPTMYAVLAEIPVANGLPSDELDRIVRVFGIQERGEISAEYADTLRTLRETHRLGVVSNVWAPSRFFYEAFDEAGITGLFDAIVFSSDSGIIKPAPRIFEKALSAFTVPRERVVYIGDSHKRDVVGARAAGIASVWITDDAASAAGADCQPDLIIRDLAELVTAPAV